MKTVKRFIITFISGVIVGFAIFFFLTNRISSNSDAVKIIQLSGEKIAHGSFDFAGSAIKFKTISDGKGEAETEIPKTLIPEANNWLNRVQSVTLTYGYKFSGHDASPYFGVMYGYRFSRVTLGGGIDFSYDFIGVKASAGICW